MLSMKLKSADKAEKGWDGMCNTDSVEANQYQYILVPDLEANQYQYILVPDLAVSVRSLVLEAGGGSSGRRTRAGSA